MRGTLSGPAIRVRDRAPSLLLPVLRHLAVIGGGACGTALFLREEGRWQAQSQLPKPVRSSRLDSRRLRDNSPWRSQWRQPPSSARASAQQSPSQAFPFPRPVPRSQAPAELPQSPLPALSQPRRFHREPGSPLRPVLEGEKSSNANDAESGRYSAGLAIYCGQYLHWRRHGGELGHKARDGSLREEQQESVFEAEAVSHCRPASVPLSLHREMTKAAPWRPPGPRQGPLWQSSTSIWTRT